MGTLCLGEADVQCQSHCDCTMKQLVSYTGQLMSPLLCSCLACAQARGEAAWERLMGSGNVGGGGTHLSTEVACPSCGEKRAQVHTILSGGGLQQTGAVCVGGRAGGAVGGGTPSCLEVGCALCCFYCYWCW